MLFDHHSMHEKHVSAEKKQKMKDGGVDVKPGDTMGDALDDYFASLGFKFRP